MRIDRVRFDGEDIEVRYAREVPSGWDEFMLASADRPAAEFLAAWCELPRYLWALVGTGDGVELYVAEVRMEWDDDLPTSCTLVASLSGEGISSGALRVKHTFPPSGRMTPLRTALIELAGHCRDYVQGVRQQMALPGLEPVGAGREG